MFSDHYLQSQCFGGHKKKYLKECASHHFDSDKHLHRPDAIVCIDAYFMQIHNQQICDPARYHSSDSVSHLPPRTSPLVTIYVNAFVCFFLLAAKTARYWVQLAVRFAQWLFGISLIRMIMQ